MSGYPLSVVGLAYEGRGDYIRQNVTPGDALSLRAEPENRYDADAIAVFHQWQKIGYVPAGSHWLAEALASGLVLEVVAGQLEYDEYAIPVILPIEVMLVDEPMQTTTVGGVTAVSTAQTPQSVLTRPASQKLAIVVLLLMVLVITCGLGWFYLSR